MENLCQEESTRGDGGLTMAGIVGVICIGTDDSGLDEHPGCAALVLALSQDIVTALFGPDNYVVGI